MESRRILKEIYIGIAVYAFIFMIIGIIFVKPAWLFAVSLLVGAACACFQIYNIYCTLDRVLDTDSKSAKRFAMIRSMIRLVICMALMIGAIIIHWSAFVGVTVGLLGLKVSALFNPIIKKVMNKLTGVDDTLDIEQK